MSDYMQVAEAAGIQSPPLQLRNKAGREAASMHDRVGMLVHV